MWWHYNKSTTVGERRAMARRAKATMRAQGISADPVVIEGRTIAHSFWGRAWCENLERYSDYTNRLPRGRTYVRGGAVLDLRVEEGTIHGLVQGSELYRQQITISPLSAKRWRALTERCTGELSSLMELLRGELSYAVMREITDPKRGLFPEPREISLRCSCPDWAVLCKHVAAVLYGVGNRLDREPALLFTLRGVDPNELLTRASLSALDTATDSAGALEGDLEDIFGIALEDASPSPEPARATRTKKASKRRGASGARSKRQGTDEPSAPQASAKRTPSVARTRPAKASMILRKELLARGIPSSTIQSWLLRGVLERTDERGVYRAPARTQEELAQHSST